MKTEVLNPERTETKVKTQTVTIYRLICNGRKHHFASKAEWELSGRQLEADGYGSVLYHELEVPTDPKLLADWLDAYTGV